MKKLQIILGLALVAVSAAAIAECDENKLCVGQRYIMEDPHQNICTITALTQKSEQTGFWGNSRPNLTAQARCSGRIVNDISRYNFRYVPSGCTPAVSSTVSNGAAFQVCVGDEMEDSGASVQVIGRERSNDGTFMIVDHKGARSIASTELGKRSGCIEGGKLCVGDNVLFDQKAMVEAQGACDSIGDGIDHFGWCRSHRDPHHDRFVSVTIVSMHLDGTFGTQRYGGDDRPEVVDLENTYFAVMHGTSQGLSVGDKVTVNHTGRKATVAALNLWLTGEDGSKIPPRFVLKFDDDSEYGGNWRRSDLTPVATSTAPASPAPVPYLAPPAEATPAPTK